ncbi:MAG TPA: hypothetical protein VJA26_18775 [Gammaproteobacteria bacterium]|nr:hypothetical protein [Gammaproteobacteria bacterium]
METREVGLLLIGAAALLSAGQAPAAMRATEEFKDGSTRPVSIALLPVQATVVKAKVVETEELIEESTELGALLGRELDAVMEANGYAVELISPERVNADPQLQEYVIDANRRHDEMLGQLRLNRVKRRIYNAGDEIRLLADYLGVDAIAFSRLQVVAATGGRTAVALLVGIGSIGGTSSTLSLVDGDTADLEALFTSTYAGASYKAIEENPEGQMAQVAKSTLNRLPPADASVRAEEGDDEDVLSDVESLLNE